LKAQDLIAKAIRAAASARVLLDAGDADGACNRSYYAMFDAARAALLASGAPVDPETTRTHNGLISAFSLHLVKTGRVPVKLGKALNKAEELRLVADYKGDPIEKEDSAWAVSQAQAFVEAMQAAFMPSTPENSRSPPGPPQEPF
jgi:uncharacterized protein